MPTYEFQCQNCQKITLGLYRIAERPEKIECANCGGQAQFIISRPMIQMSTVQDVPWLRDFARTRKSARFGKKPIETRQEYHQHLKDHDLRPCDGDNLSEV